MFATFHTPADLSFPQVSPKAMLSRLLAALAAALAAAEARARARQNSERLMGSEAAMRDVGVSAADVRRATKDMDGWC